MIKLCQSPLPNIDKELRVGEHCWRARKQQELAVARHFEVTHSVVSPHRYRISQHYTQNMAWSLTEDAFAGLLNQLDADRERAGEKYEDLRRMLLRFFEWRGASFVEERTDEALNRLARKLTDGVVVNDLRSYAMQIARLVLLESFKGRDARRAAWEELPHEPAVDPQQEWFERETADRNRRCLTQCLQQLPDDSRQLLLAYYQHSGRAQIEYRAALAVRLGLRRDALANRTQRLRDKLAECVMRCVNKK